MPPTLEQAEETHSGEDTIVVKGEHHWSRPSSPDSMSPEIEPLVANLLRQINAPQNNHPQDLESPEPLEQERPIPKQLPVSRRARRSSPKTSRVRQSLTIAATMEERLLAMPALRPLPWREGVEPGADNETGGDSRRKQIRYGCLLATRGDIQEVPCFSCSNGRGKFSVCVALDGFFKGACASCQLSGRPNRCSIKKNDDDPSSPTAGPAVSPSQKPKSKPKARASTGKAQQTPTGSPQSKRRRTTDKVPDWESARPQWEQELGDSQARQQMNEIVQRPWVTVNHPTSTQPPQGMINGLNGAGSDSQSAVEHRSSMGSMGWATVNQPAPPPPPPLQTYHDGTDINGSDLRTVIEQARSEEIAGNEDGSVALIDRLPKNKQRQVYGLVSGLQGGIEHLQRELDSLKKALGIDDES